MNALKATTNYLDNGERVRSLLCGREVLAMQSGMAELIKGGVGCTHGCKGSL